METTHMGPMAPEGGSAGEPGQLADPHGLFDGSAFFAALYRAHSSETREERWAIIERAKTIGFPLKYVEYLLDVRGDGPSTRARLRVRAEAKLAEIDRELAALHRMRHILRTVKGACRGDGPLRGRPVLDALYCEAGGRRE